LSPGYTAYVRSYLNTAATFIIRRFPCLRFLQESGILTRPQGTRPRPWPTLWVQRRRPRATKPRSKDLGFKAKAKAKAKAKHFGLKAKAKVMKQKPPEYRVHAMNTILFRWFQLCNFSRDAAAASVLSARSILLLLQGSTPFPVT